MPESLSIATPDGPRRCLAVRPAGGGPLPVVVVLHGAGATAAWTLDETGLAEAARRHGFLAVLPEGSRLDPARPPGFLVNPQVWNDASPHARSVADDVGFLDALLDELPRRYPLDRRRVYLAGFSNGAGLAFRYAAERSRRLAALAALAGYCWVPRPQPERAVPTLYLVGDSDPLVPLDGGEVVSPWGGLLPRPPVRHTLRRWADALGCPPEPRRVEDADGVRVEHFGPGRDGAVLEAYTVAGLGHHWPGGRGQLKPRLAGPPSDRVRANELLWDFFRRHGLP
jgi:polyhydroxybutyrate depolymerase